MRHLCSIVQDFLRDESGVTSIEYGMIGSLIAVVILAAVAAIGSNLCERFRSVALALGATDVAACN